MPTRYRKHLALAFAIAAFALVTAACGSKVAAGDCLVPEDGRLVPAECTVPPGVTPDPTATPTPDQGNGGTPAGFRLLQTYGCTACHAIDGTSATGAVGPNLTHVGAEGAAYIRESIVDPNAVIAQDCPGGPCASPSLMPAGFGTAIPAADLDAIVEYLSTLQ